MRMLKLRAWFRYAFGGGFLIMEVKDVGKAISTRTRKATWEEIKEFAPWMYDRNN